MAEHKSAHSALLLLLLLCRLTDEQLGDNLLLIMLAGHDTSSTTLTNVMANLQVRLLVY
jgi:cytochrome P450